MHDLVGLYATTLPTDPGERDTATRRLLDHYTTTTKAADAHLWALPGQTAPDRFTGRDHALEWLDAERLNLTAAVTLATALGEYLSWRRYLDELVTVATVARDAATHLGNPASEGMAWGNLGIAQAEVRRFDEAITAHTTARDLFQQTGDRHGEGMAWTNLGNTLVEVRRFDEAITAHTTARDLHQQAGDRHREASAWNNLGAALQEVRRFDEAITAVGHAVTAFTETGAADDAENARRLVQAIKDASGRPDPEGEAQS